MKKKQPKQGHGAGLTREDVLEEVKRYEVDARLYLQFPAPDHESDVAIKKRARLVLLAATLLRKHAETMGDGA